MMKRFVLVLSLAVLAGFAAATVAVADEKSDAVARGAKLFADATLGTNGKSCATCHGNGSGWAGMTRFPKLGLGKLRTLDQAVQTCIVNPMAGKALAWDDQRLTDLAVFTDAAYAPKK